MRTSWRIPCVALALLGGCLVSTDELRPRTAADCAAGEKACGWRCVSLNDASTGCDEPESCEPVDLQANQNHCGACGHWCEGTCSFGTCTPRAISRGAVGMRGIVHRSGGIYWLETLDGGRLAYWAPNINDGTFTGPNVVVLASGLDPRAGAPSLNRIAANPSVGALYVVGSSIVPPENLTLYSIDPVAPGAPTRLYGDTLALADVIVDGVAATAEAVYWTRSDSADLSYWSFAGSAASTLDTGAATAGSIRGLAPWGPNVYYGYPDGGGTIARTSSAPIGTEEDVRPNMGSVPHRLAVYEGLHVELYWQSEDDGSVRYMFLDGVPTTGTVYPGPGTAHSGDVTVDSGGVYWIDRGTGEIWMWRVDGTVFQLAQGVDPVGIATDGTYLYWTDNAGYVMRVPR